MRMRTTILTTLAFALALVLSAFIAGGSATIIEKRSRTAVRIAMETAGHSWVQVQADGLQVILLGTAPSEAERFRALTLAGSIVDNSRIVDNTDAETAKAIAPPSFSLEMLRNDEGISLIGLVPAATDRKALIEDLRALAGDGTVTDMLESADYPVPPGWQLAFDFGIATIKTLPRAKISIDPGRVEVEAITDSPEEKARIETSLARRRPVELALKAEISAPRPVITPFTLRFLIDANGARFDACSADTERARNRILAAARDAGAKGTQGCTIGMGTPSPQWSDAVVMGLKALKELGAGTITFSNADIALDAADTVSQASFDKVVGELESNLPEVFSLKAELAKKVEDAKTAPEFSASLGENGKVELRGRVTSERGREAMESFARAQFGAGQVYGATRVDADLPQGWPVRVLTALEALHGLAQGKVVVTPDQVTLSGVTGDAQGSDKVARLFAQRLGESARISLDVKYDKRLDPVLGLPDGTECASRLNGVLSANKITFEPGSAKIAAEDGAQLDALAKAMKQCQDFRMEVAGHTDSQGSEDGNQVLSQSRAEAVLSALRERRILTENLVAKGYGESQPIADNGTEEGREANRRIEFVLLDEKPVSSNAPLPQASADATAKDDEAEPDMAAAIAAAESGGDTPEFTGDAGPMEDATGEPLAGIGNEAPAGGEAAEPAPEAAPADAAAPASDEAAPEAVAAPDGSIEIPVGTGAESPARPKPRPEGLGQN
ncbi:MAG: OmpA family protein [Paenirhodobacter sp.]|uniref:OmpA family protein n=1 Tax=Paenirhodobacter sp. TaxID=1965326 RepID=UPI003D117742